MTKAWVISWIENDNIYENTLYMIHTYSSTYAHKIINYLEEERWIHKWCRVDGIDVGVTGDLVSHFRGKSRVIMAVFGG